MSNTLIATVGSNPLPVLVSILAIKPDRVRLIYTPDVQYVVDRIYNHLNRQCHICPLEIKDHQKVDSIRSVLESIEKDEDWPTTSLNYTGATKLMAVHVHSFWKEKGGRPENASYLGADGKLYFDDANKNPMSEEKLPKLNLASNSRSLYLTTFLNRPSNDFSA